jgi:predicted PurR-regulated permease PerM
MVESINNLGGNINIYLNDSKTFILSISDSNKYKELVESFYSNISSTVVGWFSTDNLEHLFLIVREGVFTTLKTIYNLVIGFVISIYILFDKEKFKGQIKKMLYALFDEDKVNRILENTNNADRVFSNFFSAKLLDSLIVGIICFVGMIIFKMPYATMISVIVGVTNIIPYFGPYIGAIPSALIILLVDPSKCLWFLLFIFILQQFDGNVLGPKILGDKTGLSSFWVLFSLLVFGSLFGVVGMIIGVPIFSILYSYINNVLKDRLKEKKMPINSSDYIEVKKVKKRTRKKAILR